MQVMKHVYMTDVTSSLKQGLKSSKIVFVEKLNYPQALDRGFNIHCLAPAVYSSYSYPRLPVSVFISLLPAR